MIEDGIFDGDYLFVKKQPVARTGEIVVAMIEGEATVKRYFPEGDRIRFQPANARLSPIFVEKGTFRQTDILGVVVGVYRKV
jgi:repressor LexA